MTIIEDRLPAIVPLVLAAGAHSTWEDGAGVMEAVAYIAGEPFSDRPQCAGPVLGAFLRSWNDALDDEARQELKPYIPRLVGTAGTWEQENVRAWLALDWLVRDYTPVWLRLAGLNQQADRLTQLPEFLVGMDVPATRPVIDAVREDARAAAWDAARDAAWVAGAAAGAAWAAARAARAAAWVAGVAAWAAAWADGAAAWAAARDAAWAARAAAGVAWAAGAALAPAVAECQRSAHLLVDRMIRVTETVS